MKLLYKSNKFKRYNKRHSRKQHKHRLEYLKYKKNKKSPRSKQYRKIYQQKYHDEKLDYQLITAPEEFLFIENNNTVLEFIDSIHQCYTEKKGVYIKMNKVIKIDHSAITVLQSMLSKFKEASIYLKGDYPMNEEVKSLIVNSGFSWNLGKSDHKKCTEYCIGQMNQMITIGETSVESELGKNIMESTAMTIWGTRYVLKGLQRTLVELMQNTNNHATMTQSEEANEKWWISVNHNKENKKVTFIFVDFGVGIFSSLSSIKHRWYQSYKKLKTMFKSNHEVLKAILEGKLHQTVTGQKNRGRGLPGIKECYDRNQISGLVIITNDVYVDVDKSIYKSNTKFNGTFFKWEINEGSERTEWVN